MCYFNIIEDNELSFVELFTNKVIVSEHVTIYYNCNIDDEFFNRIVVKDVNALEDIAKAVNILKSKGITPFIYSIGSINMYGYSLYDSIVTLVHDNTVRGNNSNIICKEASDVDTWLDVFFTAFNITNHNYRDEFGRRIKKYGNNLILDLVYKKDNPIGCSALFISNNVMGIYCLGVIKEHRRRGVASMLLRDAITKSKERDMMLIVQTFARDMLLPFYYKNGFRYAYSKLIYTTY